MSDLADLKDICVRMQEAWDLTDCVIGLELTPHLIQHEYAGMCTSWRGRPYYRVQIWAKLSRERRIWVLAHELRHVIQRRRGWFKGQAVWQGHVIDTSRMDYNDRPWEQDANSWANDMAPLFYTVQRQSFEVTGRSFLDRGRR